MAKKELKLYVDQYNHIVMAATIAELREKAGGGRVSKMYVDGKGGKTYHTGYVVGQRWFSMFRQTRNEVTR